MRELKDRYEIFLKVCETGSFSKAAEALNYTQSGISQMMAGLEEELGVQLFARINRGVTLTDNGTRLLPYVRELANQKDRLRQAAFNINHKVEGKLRVGSISSITTRWMPEVVHYFKKHYPKVEMAILDGNYDEIRDWIIHGQIDCGFLSSIVADDLAFYPLLDDPLCAVFPEGHPLAAQESVTLPQLFQYPLIIETPGCDNDIQHLIHNQELGVVLPHSLHRIGKVLLHLPAALLLLLLVHLEYKLAGGGGSLDIMVVRQRTEYLQLAAGGAL